MAISLRQQLFVTYYLGEAKGNSVKSARMAGYSHPEVTGPRLRSTPRIVALIDDSLASSAMHRDEVLARLTMLARTDAGDFLTFDSDKDDANPKLSLGKARRLKKLGVVSKLTQKSTRVKVGTEWTTEERVEVHLHNPIQSLELLAKFHGLVSSPLKIQVAEEPAGENKVNPVFAKAALAALRSVAGLNETDEGS